MAIIGQMVVHDMRIIINIAVFIVCYAISAHSANYNSIIAYYNAASDEAASYDLLYDVDHVSGTDYAYLSVGSLQGSITGAIVSTTESASGNSVFFDAADDNVAFAITAKDIFDSAEGSMSFWFFPDITGDNSTLFEAFVTSNTDEFSATLFGGSNQIVVNHEGQNSRVSLTLTTVLSDDVAYWVEIEWSAASNILRGRVCDDADCTGESWENDVDGDPVTAFTTEPTNFRLGELELGDTIDEFYLDDFYLWTDYAQN